MSLQEGRLLGIAVREKSRGSMEEMESLAVTTSQGLVGDFRGKPGPRQVTVLAREDWNSACETLGKDLPWTVRRANLLIEGVKLRETTGSIIRIGELTLQVMGETDPCSRMDETEPGLREALLPDWRGGVCCRVVEEGEISLGASVIMEFPS